MEPNASGFFLSQQCSLRLAGLFREFVCEMKGDPAIKQKQFLYDVGSGLGHLKSFLLLLVMVVVLG